MSNDSHFQQKPRQIETKNKKFSVIIPIYNTEKYLPECIESVIRQSYKNLEIILVNDGSPGNADEICRKYIQLDSRIEYIKQQNQGVAIARNNGIAASTGDYVFCADSDDTLEKEFIEKVSKVFEKESCDCIVIGEDFCQIPIQLIGALPTWGIAVTKKFLDKYPDVRFQEHMQPCEDGLFTHKVMALTDKMSLCKSVKYFYRQHSASSERNLTVHKMLRDIPKWFEILEEFYTKYNLWNEKKLHLLAFINNEPHGRFCNMQFSDSERKYLFNLIHKFIKKHKLNDINLANRFPDNFYRFVMSDFYFTYKNKPFLESILERIKDSSGRTVSIFLEHIKDSSGRAVSIFLQNIFSVKNVRKGNCVRKQVKLLGIKVKFKDRYKTLLNTCDELQNEIDRMDRRMSVMNMKVRYLEYQRKHEIVLEKLRKEKRKLRVCFLVSENQKWNAQFLYDAMEKSKDFYPFVVVTRLSDMTGRCSFQHNVEFFKNCCKNVEIGFDERTNRSIDLKSFKPDIVFYQQPWNIHENQSPVHILDCALPYYFSYSISNAPTCLHYSFENFFAVLQKFFVFSEKEKQQYIDMYGNDNWDISVVGHPKLDIYNNYEEKDFSKKYVIYAPHHSFPENSILHYGTFDWNGKYVLEWAKSHPELNWVFKPHPQLKQTLLYTNLMTKDEIEQYYQDWADIGTYYDDGNYFDLFKNSRCLITDCGSFLTEYFPTKNPVIHLRNPKGTDYSATNKIIMQTYYDTWNIEQLRSYLEDILLNVNDVKREERLSLLNKLKIGKDNCAEKIIKELKKDLERRT